jgi:hypothetical protein
MTSMQTGRTNRSAIFLGLAVGAGSLATGCEKPESGSLENVKQRKAAPLDYSKLDYAKIDYKKIDYSKLDYNKLDPKLINPEMLAKLPEDKRAAIATKNVGLVPSENVSKEIARRLENRLAAAKEAGDEELVAKIQEVSKAIELSMSKEFIGPDMPLCW